MGAGRRRGARTQGSRAAAQAPGAALSCRKRARSHTEGQVVTVRPYRLSRFPRPLLHPVVVVAKLGSCGGLMMLMLGPCLAAPCRAVPCRACVVAVVVGRPSRVHPVQDAAAVQGIWDAQHTWAGQEMYKLCISLRGFYLKVRRPCRRQARPCPAQTDGQTGGQAAGKRGRQCPPASHAGLMAPTARARAAADSAGEGGAGPSWRGKR